MKCVNWNVTDYFVVAQKHDDRLQSCDCLLPSIRCAAVAARDIEVELNQNQIEAMLDRGVAETVAYVRQHSPFYRQHFSGLPEIRGIADLSKLPLTTKHHVSQYNRQFWAVAGDRFVDVATTSGTTGEPTLYPITQKDLDRLGHNEQLCFTRAGLSCADVVLLAVTMDKCFMAGLAYFEGLRRLGATTVRVGAGSPAMLLSMVQRLGATAIVSVPSFLKRVAEFAREQSIDLHGVGVRKLICIGEPIRDMDWKLSPPGAQIAGDWNASLYSTYGITELASSLCECSAGRGGHLHPELLHAEVIDDEGQPVPDGAIGQLVATTIGVEAMPMVRFATGDMTFLTRERCDCGLWTPRIGPILGRRDQAMKIKGATVYPAAVQRALHGIQAVGEYLLIATSPTSLSDELEVVIALRPGCGAESALELIREKLRGELRVSPSIRFATPGEIAALGASRELRKQRVFLDRRTRHAC
jgi:phenylacetate-CoA ligase